jgi:hypothetical protein
MSELVAIQKIEGGTMKEFIFSAILYEWKIIEVSAKAKDEKTAKAKIRKRHGRKITSLKLEKVK